jgi:hypothetical protein
MPDWDSFAKAYHQSVLDLIAALSARMPDPDSPEGRLLAGMRAAAANYEKAVALHKEREKFGG